MIHPKPMWRLFIYLKDFKLSFSLSTLASILNKVLDLMPPLIIGWTIDSVSGNPPAWLHSLVDTQDPPSLALFFMLLIIIVFAFEGLFEWLYSLGFLNLAQRVQHFLRLDTYQKMQHREMAFFEKERIGNIMSILNNDINHLEKFLSSTLNQLIQLGTLYLFAAFTMAQTSWKLTLLSLFPIPFILIGSFYYQKKIGPFYLRIREAIGNLNSRLENGLSGIAVIKSFTKEDYELKRVEEDSMSYMVANQRAIKWNAAYIPCIRMFIALGFGLGMYVGILWVMDPQNPFTAGSLTFFAMMIQRILWPLTRLGEIVDEYERANASAKRIFHLMDEPARMTVQDHPVTMDSLKGHIAFKDVSFHYEPQLPVLSHLDFEIQPGEMIGIAGTTGSGKTTITKLLLRFYDVSSGGIFLDGHDIRHLDLHNLRHHIAVVSQDVYLFHGTVFENIAYGTPDKSQEDVIEAAKKAELHAFIESLPHGYGSIVGEKGILLSGGQRQRLSIARAILKDAPVMVFDEATSAVDTETEQAIQKNLGHITQGKTAILVAHRLSTIRAADKIIVLEKGRVAESGSHDTLLKKQGLYHELWAIQTGQIP